MIGLSTGNIVGLVLGSSVLAALATQGLAWLREFLTHKKDATYLALRLAIVFEKYGSQAAELVGELNDASSKGYMEGASSTLPVLPNLEGQSEEWRLLDTRLATRVLEFDGLRASNQASIGQVWEHLGAEEAFSNTRMFSITLGWRAFEIARLLRSRYGLPERDPNLYIPEFLENAFNELPSGERSLNSDLK